MNPTPCTELNGLEKGREARYGRTKSIYGVDCRLNDDTSTESNSIHIYALTESILFQNSIRTSLFSRKKDSNKRVFMRVI